jgi:hypothetical protein
MRTAGIEARKPFQAERLSLYLRATTAAATIAAGGKGKELEKAINEFWELYWGSLSIVEDEHMEASMVRLGRCIRSQAACEKPIQQLVLELDHACRSSLAESWDVYLASDTITFDRLERLRSEPMEDSKQGPPSR